MKKISIILLVLMIVLATPLFAADQILRAGMWAEASNLRDIRTPSELDFTLNPYLYYEFGRPSADNFTAYGYVDAPYVIGDAFDTLWPAVGAGFNYRIHSSQDAIMNTGLSLASDKAETAGTYIDALGHFYWYPYNRATEVTVIPHFGDFVDGLRFGLGLEAGAAVENLLEDADIATIINGGLVGRMAAGAQLSERFWLQTQLKLKVPAFVAPSSFDTYGLHASGILDTSFGYYGDRLYLTTGLYGKLVASNLFTQDGLLEGAAYQYDFNLWGELGFFVIENLNVYAGAEFSGWRGVSDDSAVAYFGVEYYLL
jgi:hypothetical protein